MFLYYSKTIHFSKLRGFTLVEVLVSWFLLSIALFALLKLDETSLLGARASLLQAVAQSQLNDGLSLLALRDERALSAWQTNLNYFLPKAQALLSSPTRLSLSWQTPELDKPLSLSYPT